ncbi:hypothetical protein [Celeribacter sp.]|uniref:hypothetical protein n=1 Tax=Celeribacter sp. TaxID=1890673 RepID=UPI003A8CFC68
MSLVSHIPAPRPLLPMRLALVAFTVGAMLPSFFHTIVREAGLGTAICLTAAAAGSSAFFGPIFLRWWAGSAVAMLTSGFLTMLLSAGMTCLLALAASVLLVEEPITTLASAPLIFVSGALVAPLAVISAPASIILWLLGVLLVGCAARRAVRQQSGDAGTLTDGPYDRCPTDHLHELRLRKIRRAPPRSDDETG